MAQAVGHSLWMPGEKLPVILAFHLTHSGEHFRLTESLQTSPDRLRVGKEVCMYAHAYTQDICRVKMMRH